MTVVIEVPYLAFQVNYHSTPAIPVWRSLKAFYTSSKKSKYSPKIAFLYFVWICCSQWVDFTLQSRDEITREILCMNVCNFNHLLKMTASYIDMHSTRLSNCCTVLRLTKFAKVKYLGVQQLINQTLVPSMTVNVHIQIPLTGYVGLIWHSTTEATLRVRCSYCDWSSMHAIAAVYPQRCP